MKDIFSIKDIALMTGLSTRTIRNYIAADFLEGDKIDGVWTFNTEQVERFMQNNAVKPAIRAKKNAIVYDFMGTKPNGQNKMCIILDMDSKEAIEASIFFCKNISDCKPEAELRFSSDPIGTGVRIILSGSPKDIMELINNYYTQEK